MLIVTYGASSWKYNPAAIKQRLKAEGAIVIDSRDFYSNQTSWDQHAETLKDLEALGPIKGLAWGQDEGGGKDGKESKGKSKGKGKTGGQGKSKGKATRRPPHFEPGLGWATDMALRDQALPELFEMLNWRSS